MEGNSALGLREAAKTIEERNLNSLKLMEATQVMIVMELMLMETGQMMVLPLMEGGQMMMIVLMEAALRSTQMCKHIMKEPLI